MKLLLTGAFHYSHEQLEYLISLGYEITFVQDERVSIGFDVSDIEAVICNGLFLYTPIEKFKSLKFIQLTAAGYDRVPIDYINKHNIKISNARGVYSAPMAEFAVCGVLQLYKNARFFYENQKAHKWEKHRGLLELTGKNVLIIGAGSIGTQVAKRFKSFEANVIGVDLYTKNNDYFDTVFSLDRLDEQLSMADIVILSLPYSENNKGFFGKAKFCQMKSTAIFVNLSRGKLVNQNDLTDALINKKLNGAVLDVFETEPLDEHSPLWDMENVIITPHNSFIGDLNSKRMFDIIKNNLKDLLNE